MGPDLNEKNEKMKKRYRLKLIATGVTGTLGFVLRLFPNGLTFVGYPTSDQLQFVASASTLLGAFGVAIEVTESQ